MLEAGPHEHPVLAHHRDDVAGGRDGHEVEERPRLLRREAERVQDALDQLEPDAAPAEPLERVGAVRPLGVEDSHGVRDGRAGGVVVADDEVEPFRLRIGRLLHGRNPTVEGDDERGAALHGHVDPDLAEPVAVLEPVGDEERRFDALRAEERQHHRRRGRPVHVVIAVDEDALALSDGASDPLDRQPHVPHQVRVVETG